MGFPSSGAEGIYRNPLPEVKRFLDEMHRGKYMLYNLCSERMYSPDEVGHSDTAQAACKGGVAGWGRAGASFIPAHLHRHPVAASTDVCTRTARIAPSVHTASSVRCLLPPPPSPSPKTSPTRAVAFVPPPHTHTPRTLHTSQFEGRVQCFPFDDHNPCPLRMIEAFCRSVDAWLAADKDNVVAVHCKAGKGRTGLMVSAYLLHSNFRPSAERALSYFGSARTANAKGVTIPRCGAGSWPVSAGATGGFP
jgi:hypothetical protein